MKENKYPRLIEVAIVRDKKQGTLIRYVMCQMVLSPREGEKAAEQRYGPGLRVSMPRPLRVWESVCLCLSVCVYMFSDKA